MRVLLQTLFFFLMVTQIGFAQWVQVGLTDKSIKDIAVQNSNIFAVTSDSGRMYRSLNDGASWTTVFESFATDAAISPTGRVLMVSDSAREPGIEYFLKGDFHYSIDNGDTWIWVDMMEQLQDSLPWPAIYPCRISVGPTGIAFCGLNQFVELWCGHLAVSTDEGLTWTTPAMGFTGGNLIDFKGQFVLTDYVASNIGGSYGAEILLSSDYGITWNFLGYPPVNYTHALGLFTNGNVIISGEVPWIGGNGSFITTDMCSTWSQISSLNSQVGLTFSDGTMEGMLLGTEDSGVFLYSDEGDSLGSRNEGLTNLNVQALTLDNSGYVYAGTENGVWRRALTEVTAVEENSTSLPSSYILSQNYPNPFNPSTKIKYSIPQSSQVSLKLFNTLGQEIETLVNEEKTVGTYEITWYAENLPSGVYFYQLRAGEFIQTHKMILAK